MYQFIKRSETCTQAYGPTSIGGGGRPSFARMDSGGGGSSSRNFPGSIFCGGGGVVAEISRDPYSVGCHNLFR